MYTALAHRLWVLETTPTTQGYPLQYKTSSTITYRSLRTARQYLKEDCSLGGYTEGYDNLKSMSVDALPNYNNKPDTFEVVVTKYDLFKIKSGRLLKHTVWRSD